MKDDVEFMNMGRWRILTKKLFYYLL